MLKTGTTAHVFDCDDILYICAEGSYTAFYLADDYKLIVSKNLNTISKLLGDYVNFCRIHHSHIINANHVVTYESSNTSVILSDGRELSVARSRRQDFLDCFLQL